MTPLFSCHDLSITIPGRTLVDALSFEAAPGELLAVLGQNGSGKTLTAINLAISLAQEVNHTVLLVDLDRFGQAVGEAGPLESLHHSALPPWSGADEGLVMIHGGTVVAEGSIRGVREEITSQPIQVLVRCDRPQTVAAEAFGLDHVVEARIVDDDAGAEHQLFGGLGHRRGICLIGYFFSCLFVL